MPSVRKDDLKKYVNTHVESGGTNLANLRLQYSESSTLLNHFVSKVLAKERIYPRILPTQASGRWSTVDPPLTNFPKKCINPLCPKERHRKTKECWSMRDIIGPDLNTFWIEFDLDAVEARIYALLLGWKERLEEFEKNYDIHTPVTCSLFDLPFPQDKVNPHDNDIDELWRIETKWQGKDDKRRTMSKNFTYGGQYFLVEIMRNGELKYSPEYVFSIPDIEEYGLEKKELISLAHKFVKATYNIQYKKAEWQARIRKDKIARTLYGARRVFFMSDKSTAKDGFNHVIQGTVVDYMNQTACLIQEEFPDSYVVHNAHDNFKWCFPLDLVKTGKEINEYPVMRRFKELVERDLEYNGLSTKITGTFRIIYPRSF